MDSEGLLHAAASKRAYREGGITILSAWPKYSPELNPQENVWPRSEILLRHKEGSKGTTFENFKKLAVEAVEEYKGAKNLIGGMVGCIEQCIATKGTFINK